MINKIFATFLVLVLVGCASSPGKTVLKYQEGKIEISKDKTVFIDMEFDKPLAFYGAYSFDELNSTQGNVMYPGNNAATFLAAIAVHAATSSAVQSSAHKRVIDKANEVLEPYRGYLDSLSARNTFGSVIVDLNNSYDFNIESHDDFPESVSGWVVKTLPVFYLTQDEKELTLKNHISFYAIENPGKVIGENIIEVASNKVEAETPYVEWVDNNLIMSVSNQLYLKSVKLFIEDVLSRYKNESEQQLTFRYVQGGKNRFERGSLVKSDCSRIVIRTLRGWLLSLPQSAMRNQVVTSDKNDCEVGSGADVKSLANAADAAADMH